MDEEKTSHWDLTVRHQVFTSRITEGGTFHTRSVVGVRLVRGGGAVVF